MFKFKVGDRVASTFFPRVGTIVGRDALPSVIHDPLYVVQIDECYPIEFFLEKGFCNSLRCFPYFERQLNFHYQFIDPAMA